MSSFSRSSTASSSRRRSSSRYSRAISSIRRSTPARWRRGRAGGRGRPRARRARRSATAAASGGRRGGSGERDLASATMARGERMRRRVRFFAATMCRTRVRSRLGEEVDGADGIARSGRCGARVRCADRASPDSRGCRSARPRRRAAGSIPRRRDRWRRRDRCVPRRKASIAPVPSRAVASPQRSRRASDRAVAAAPVKMSVGSSVERRFEQRRFRVVGAFDDRSNARQPRHLLANGVDVEAVRGREQVPEQDLLKRIRILLGGERAGDNRGAKAARPLSMTRS